MWERPAYPSQIVKAKDCKKPEVFWPSLSLTASSEVSKVSFLRGWLLKRCRPDLSQLSFVPQKVALAGAPAGCSVALWWSSQREDHFTGGCGDLVRSTAQQSACCCILDGGWGRDSTGTNETCTNTLVQRPPEQWITRHFILSFLNSLVAKSWF